MTPRSEKNPLMTLFDTNQIWDKMSTNKTKEYGTDEAICNIKLLDKWTIHKFGLW